MNKSYIQNLLNDENNPIKLSLYEYPGAEESFPIDEYGQHPILFGNKKYKFGSHILRCCEYFKNQFKNNSSNEQLNIELKYAKSETAFDIAMKLLYGFKEVTIPDNDLIEFFLILNELGINDKNNFREKAEELIISKITSNNLFDAFEAGLNINNFRLRDKCTEILGKNAFRDILFQRERVIKMNENSFFKLMELHYETKKKTDKSSQYLTSVEIRELIKEYCDKNYASDKELRDSKFAKFLELFLTIGPNEPPEVYQTLYKDDTLSTLSQDKFLRKQLELVHDHMLKLDMQNEEIRKENQMLKEEIQVIKEIIRTRENTIPKSLAETLQSITEELKKISQALVDGFRDSKKRDDNMMNAIGSLMLRVDALTEVQSSLMRSDRERSGVSIMQSLPQQMHSLPNVNQYTIPQSSVSQFEQTSTNYSYSINMNPINQQKKN